MPRTLLIRTVSNIVGYLEVSNSTIHKLSIFPLQLPRIPRSQCISSQPTESNLLFWDQTVCRTTTKLLNRLRRHSTPHLPPKRRSLFMTIVMLRTRMWEIMTLLLSKSRLNRKPPSEALAGTKSLPMLSVLYIDVLRVHIPSIHFTHLCTVLLHLIKTASPFCTIAINDCVCKHSRLLYFLTESGSSVICLY